MSPQWFKEQGRDGLNGPPPPSIDHLHPDINDSREVYILVYGPTERGLRASELHWSLAWYVREGAVRHIHIVSERVGSDSRGRRLVYWGPVTKSPPKPGSATVMARKISLGPMTFQMRQAVETLSWQIPVQVPDGRWNCQLWIIDLLNKMVQKRIITEAIWSDVIAKATHAYPELMGR
ncbi:hypothetical protein C8Q74DRAFT_1371053 [Fomes fomentarius]|nr:hypothetical protein C8Q74DRAFT_1371053 [Fomes fomentarius]